MPEKTTRILVVSATELEMINDEFAGLEKLSTGVGMVATSTALTRRLSNSNIDLVLNIGIAGTFNPDLKIGDVTQLVSDRLVEVGVEDRGKFLPADEMGLCDSSELKFESNVRIDGLPESKGITVNRVHGSADSIEKVIEQFNPDVETMEGAAVAYVCQQFGVPWVQIRAISNVVEPRNRENWNIPLAIENLHLEVTKYLKSLNLEA